MLKEEFMLNRVLKDFTEVKALVEELIGIYNNERSDMNIRLLTPSERYAS